MSRSGGVPTGIGFIIFWGIVFYLLSGGDEDNKNKIKKLDNEQSISQENKKDNIEIQLKEVINIAKHETKKVIKSAKEEIEKAKEEIKEKQKEKAIPQEIIEKEEAAPELKEEELTYKGMKKL